MLHGYLYMLAATHRAPALPRGLLSYQVTGMCHQYLVHDTTHHWQRCCSTCHRLYLTGIACLLQYRRVDRGNKHSVDTAKQCFCEHLGSSLIVMHAHKSNIHHCAVFVLCWSGAENTYLCMAAVLWICMFHEGADGTSGLCTIIVLP